MSRTVKVDMRGMPVADEALLRAELILINMIKKGLLEGGNWGDYRLTEAGRKLKEKYDEELV